MPLLELALNSNLEVVTSSSSWPLCEVLIRACGHRLCLFYIPWVCELKIVIGKVKKQFYTFTITWSRFEWPWCYARLERNWFGPFLAPSPNMGTPTHKPKHRRPPPGFKQVWTTTRRNQQLGHDLDTKSRPWNTETRTTQQPSWATKQYS